MSRILKATSPAAQATIVTKDGREFKLTQNNQTGGAHGIASFDAVEALTLLIKSSPNWLVCDNGELVPVANISWVKVSKV